ncbi:HNH endonuclease signature motif containing protein [Sphingobium naphthae]|uniref:HNH endonuclease signature motif containing protein n=1 Tax=Sphingobium naphthae TaxID=1886786 RepID=A0ABU3ZRY6_9SPHN|nr:HNH endonuclease signature motif containing protein [Sphingobium naphthae]MDV5822285.1 HNH endonuclease signature motif containing protein [Sphingobium naphthae]
MATRSDITPELCRQLLRYEPETGKLFWRPRGIEFFQKGRMQKRAHSAWNAQNANKEAFTSLSQGYKQGSILDVRLRAHRVIFAIVYGRVPECVDHINGDKCDNRIDNLREVTHELNMKNVIKPTRDREIEPGVYFCQTRKKWRARANVRCSSKTLGTFDSYEDAVAKRRDFARQNGYTERHILQKT